MATYVVLARFTDQGAKNAKDSPKRAEAFRQMAETFGVTVKDIFWTQGRYDIAIVTEAPDELPPQRLCTLLRRRSEIRMMFNLRAKLGARPNYVQCSPFVRRLPTASVP